MSAASGSTRRTISPKTLYRRRRACIAHRTISRSGHRGVFNPVGGSRLSGTSPDAALNIGRILANARGVYSRPSAPPRRCSEIPVELFTMPPYIDSTKRSPRHFVDGGLFPSSALFGPPPPQVVDPPSPEDCSLTAWRVVPREQYLRHPQDPLPPGSGMQRQLSSV
jgi:hypothetical protein